MSICKHMADGMARIKFGGIRRNCQRPATSDFAVTERLVSKIDPTCGGGIIENKNYKVSGKW